MITINVMNKLNHFEIVVNQSDFKQAFGDNLGIHLWDKFTRLNCSIVNLYGFMDTKNQDKLVTMINTVSEKGLEYC